MTSKYHFTSTKTALVKSQTIICVNKVAQEVEQSSIPSENSFLITLKNSLLLLLLSRFSCVQLCATPWTAAHQAPPSLGFPRQEYWSGLPFPSPMQESEKWKWSRSVMSESYRPHGLQPTRLLCPWDFPGKSTGLYLHTIYSSLLSPPPSSRYVLNIFFWFLNCCVFTVEIFESTEQCKETDTKPLTLPPRCLYSRHFGKFPSSLPLFEKFLRHGDLFNTMQAFKTKTWLSELTSSSD